MNRWGRNGARILAAQSLVALLVSASHAEPVEEGPPNIVYIVADDLGWADLACMGSLYYETPNLDLLAEQGMRFTDAYAPAANCAPSRACCLSGQYAPRHDVYTVGKSERGASRRRRLVPVANRTDLPLETVTIAEELEQAGYVSASIGKWHLGKDPLSQGFDHNVAGNQTGSPKGGYFSPYRNPELSDGPVGEHLPARLTTEAIRFIEENRNRPFFLYVPYYSVHTPLQGRKDLVAKYREMEGHPGQNNATYAAMIEGLDANIGRLVQALDDMDLASRTLVVFTSDNGGVLAFSSQAPLRAGKGSYYEGGIRVPLLVRWPGNVNPGSVCGTPVSGIDLYPTFLEAAGISAGEGAVLDGVSLVPLISGIGGVPDRALYWHFPIYLQARESARSDHWRDPFFRTRPGSAMRLGNWKLHEYFEDGALELYDLVNDPGERRNLVEQRPEKAAELHAMLRAWRQSTEAPVPTELNPEFVNPSPKTKTRPAKLQPRDEDKPDQEHD